MGKGEGLGIILSFQRLGRPEGRVGALRRHL